MDGLLCEVSQKEKGKYHVLSRMWNLKYDTNEFIDKIKQTHRKQTYGYQRGKSWGATN